jgi:hypothetical protein
MKSGYAVKKGSATRRRRRRTGPAIPREFAPLLDSYALDAQQRIELWTFALVLLMIDEEQVRVMGTRELAGREWLTLQTQEGEQFDIIKPDLNEDDEQQLLDRVREIVENARAMHRRTRDF